MIFKGYAVQAEILTQILLLITVLTLVGGMIAFVLTFPGKIHTATIELGAKIDRLSDAIDSLRESYGRLEQAQQSTDNRVRSLEIQRR